METFKLSQKKNFFDLFWSVSPISRKWLIILGWLINILHSVDFLSMIFKCNFFSSFSFLNDFLSPNEWSFSLTLFFFRFVSIFGILLCFCRRILLAAARGWSMLKTSGQQRRIRWRCRREAWWPLLEVRTEDWEKEDSFDIGISVEWLYFVCLFVGRGYDIEANYTMKLFFCRVFIA